MTTPSTILFVCEHGAAKSIIAAAYFNKLAGQQGLHLKAIARGTLPDDELSPDTVRGLMADGLTSTELSPQKLLSAEIQSAQRVIVFGDLFSKEEIRDIQIENWNEVPPVSKDYQTARDVILKHIHHLLSEVGNS